MNYKRQDRSLIAPSPTTAQHLIILTIRLYYRAVLTRANITSMYVCFSIVRLIYFIAMSCVNIICIMCSVKYCEWIYWLCSFVREGWLGGCGELHDLRVL